MKQKWLLNGLKFAWDRGIKGSWVRWLIQIFKCVYCSTRVLFGIFARGLGWLSDIRPDRSFSPLLLGRLQ